MSQLVRPSSVGLPRKAMRDPKRPIQPQGAPSMEQAPDTASAEAAPTLIQFSDVSGGNGRRLGEALLSSNLDLVRHVQVTVSVIAGKGALPIGELLSLKDGQVLTLETSLDAPMDIVLDGQVIARGDLVAVGDHFGVRISE